MSDRFTQAQLISMSKAQESGLTVPAICRQHDIGASTFYRWEGQYGGMTQCWGCAISHVLY